jgi:lipooligosaccharide transport system ATP-binding protein
MNHGRVIARGAPGALVAEHAGHTVREYYGAPPRLVEVETAARAAGLATRRTGPSVSILRAEQMPEALTRSLGDGVRRRANLEDVFVSLTGEVIE